MGRKKKIDVDKAIKLKAKNLTNEEIGKRLGVNESTVQKALKEERKETLEIRKDVSDFKVLREEKLLGIEKASIEKQQIILDSLDNTTLGALELDEKIKLLKTLPMVQKTAQDGGKDTTQLLSGLTVNWALLLEQASKERRDELMKGAINITPEKEEQDV